jgi:hypothetical protein
MFTIIGIGLVSVVLVLAFLARRGARVLGNRG